MKKGISRWSLPANLPLEECFRQTRAAGYDGLELAFDGEGDLDFNTTQADAEAVRRLADSHGVGSPAWPPATCGTIPSPATARRSARRASPPWTRCWTSPGGSAWTRSLWCPARCTCSSCRT